MQDIKISKVKLIKQGEKLELNYQQTSEDGRVSQISETCSNQVHPDLRKAINGLACHLAIMSDYLTEKMAMNKDELEKFLVNGYSIGGKEDEEGIVITGQRKGKHGHITLNTKFLKLDSEPDTYYLIADLNNKVSDIEAEVEKYLFENKKAPDAQLNLFPDDKKVDKIIIDHPEEAYTNKNESPVVAMADKIKKGSKKKVAQSADAPSGEVVVNE